MKKMSKIISIILSWLLFVSPSGGFCFDATDNSTLSPGLNLPYAGLRNIFQDDSLKEGKAICDFLDSWLKDNKARVQTINLDDIEEKAAADMRYYSEQINMIVSEAGVLFKKCQDHPREENFKALFGLFMAKADFFSRFGWGIKSFTKKNLEIFDYKLPPELDSLADGNYHKVYTDDLLKFLTEKMRNENIRGKVIEYLQGEIASFKQNSAALQSYAREQLSKIGQIKESSPVQWQAAEAGIIAVQLRLLMRHNKCPDHTAQIEQWLIDHTPQWQLCYEQVNSLLDNTAYLDNVFSLEIMKKIETIIAFVLPALEVFEPDRQEDFREKTAELVNKLLLKNKMLGESGQYAFFYVDEREISDINRSTHSVRTRIGEALKENRQIIIGADYPHLSVLWRSLSDSDPQTQLDLRVLAGNEEILFGKSFSEDTKHVFSKILKNQAGLKTLSLPVVCWIEELREKGFDVSAKIGVLEDEFDCLKADVIYGVLKDFYKKYIAMEKNIESPAYNYWEEEELRGAAFRIMPCLKEDVLRELLVLICKGKDDEFQGYVLTAIENIMQVNNEEQQYKQILFKLSLTHNDALVVKRIKDSIGYWISYEEKVFESAGQISPDLDRKQMGSLIEILYSGKYSDRACGEIMELVSKSPLQFKHILSYFSAVAQAQNFDAVRRFVFNDGFNNMLRADKGTHYYLLRHLARFLPKPGVSRRRPEAEEVRGPAGDYLWILDDRAIVPGYNGQSVFSGLRAMVHGDPDRNAINVFYYLLHYWGEKDPELLARGGEVLSPAIEEDVNLYNQAVLFFYDEFKDTIPEAIAGRDMPEFDMFLLSVDEEALLEKSQEFQAQCGLNTPAAIAAHKTAYTILAYQAIARKFGQTVSMLEKRVKETVLDNFDEIEASRKNMVEMLNEDNPDKLKILRQYTVLRQEIYAELTTEAESNEKKGKSPLLEYDILLEEYGKTYFNEVYAVLDKMDFSKEEDFIYSRELLVLRLKNFSYSGYANAAVWELIDQLESEDDIYLSQLVNIIGSLEFEYRQIISAISADYEGKFSRALLRTGYVGGCRLECQKQLRALGEDDDISGESAAKMDEILIGGLIREAGFPALEGMLANISELLAKRLDENDRGVVPRRRELSIDDLFWRFDKDYKEQRKRTLGICGKKGRRIAEMFESGMPVPPGMIISAEVCNNPDILESEAFNKRLEQEVERLANIGNFPEMKLFLFARSGSAYSLPGLLATIPNLGMNDAQAEALAENDPWFAYDAYGNFLRAYAIYVLGVPERDFQDILNLNKQEKPRTEEGIKDLVNKYKKLIKKHGKQVPDSLQDQVRCCIKAIYDSWNSKDALAYRRLHGISERWGTAVILQKAVFGNYPGFSGAGAATLRFDKYGQPFIEGRFRFNSQGEALMSGAPGNYVVIGKDEAEEGEFSLEEKNPQMYAELLHWSIELYKKFGQPQRAEFTIENGVLYILQSSDSNESDDTELPRFVEPLGQEPLARGRGAAGGAFCGIAAVDMQSAQELVREFKEGKYAHLDIDGVVLIVDRVNPEDINDIPKEVAIVAQEMSIHCETLARKNGISACYHFKDMEYEKEKGVWRINGTEFKNADTISFDGHINRHVYHKSGFVYKGIMALDKKEEPLSARKKTDKGYVLVPKAQEQYIAQSI
ncbi:MAG: hypothetical protein KKD05_02085 [Candidatus Omnitrophica bacterium]|nr:hypothetical protein [Candidatus Omnitrophota bacterium]